MRYRWEQCVGMAHSVNIDEAVNYGIEFLRGIAKYLGVIIILGVCGILFIFGSMDFTGYLALIIIISGVLTMIAAFIIGLALSIGAGYKLWADILLRSRRKEEVLVPLATTKDTSEWADDDYKKTI